MEELKRDAEEQLRSLRREVEQVQQDRLPTRNLLKDVCSAREVENAHPLGKLPPEVWEKILANLGENDLFPLALSCRYFRQKQKELVARARQNKAPPPTLKTTLKANFAPELVRKHRETLPASAEYLKFCMKEEEFVDAERRRYLIHLAASHGHLPLLQELLRPLNTLDREITRAAGESSSSSSSSLFLLLTSFSPLHSARRPTGDLAVAENPGGLQAGLGALCLSLRRRQSGGHKMAQERGLPLECNGMPVGSRGWAVGGIAVAQEGGLPLG